MNKEEIADLASALVGEYYAPASERDYVDDDFRYMYSVPPAALVPSSLSGWAVYDPGNVRLGVAAPARWERLPAVPPRADFPGLHGLRLWRLHRCRRLGFRYRTGSLLVCRGFAVSAVSLEVLGDDTDDARGRLERPLP